jgi:antitoxin (DNA-binding transcriptional repressor) of toxin-antitoxin stability system
MQTRTANDLAKNARDVLDLVEKSGESIEIRRYWRPVAVLVPVGEWTFLDRLREQTPTAVAAAIRDEITGDNNENKQGRG